MTIFFDKNVPHADWFPNTRDLIYELLCLAAVFFDSIY